MSIDNSIGLEDFLDEIEKIVGFKIEKRPLKVIEPRIRKLLESRECGFHIDPKNGDLIIESSSASQKIRVPKDFLCSPQLLASFFLCNNLD